MISSTLRRLRKGRGLSQDELAAVLHVSQQAVSKWETGAAEPDIRGLTALADFYGVTTDYLLGRGDGLTARLLSLRKRLTPEQTAALCGIALEMLEGKEENGETEDGARKP